VWAVYPSYDIFLATDDGTIVKRLTNTKGYDAEATVNWKQGRIVYTSMASGDLDLWTMNTDGSDKRQITDIAGYDGGAFFSRDGSQLVWRANHPAEPSALQRYRDLLARNLTTPMKMEIFLANADGTNRRQLTHTGTANFAPAFHPDNKRIIFSSNMNSPGGRTFHLFIMNTDGSNLRQVTFGEGFNSFPMFTRDGKKLVFVSDRNARDRYEFNVFIAEWVESDASAQ
jgi:Tol biopolymer transport system component